MDTLKLPEPDQYKIELLLWDNWEYLGYGYFKRGDCVGNFLPAGDFMWEEVTYH